MANQRLRDCHGSNGTWQVSDTRPANFLTFHIGLTPSGRSTRRQSCFSLPGWACFQCPSLARRVRVGRAAAGLQVPVVIAVDRPNVVDLSTMPTHVVRHHGNSHRHGNDPERQVHRARKHLRRQRVDETIGGRKPARRRHNRVGQAVESEADGRLRAVQVGPGSASRCNSSSVTTFAAFGPLVVNEIWPVPPAAVIVTPSPKKGAAGSVLGIAPAGCTCKYLPFRLAAWGRSGARYLPSQMERMVSSWLKPSGQAGLGRFAQYI